MGSLAGKLAVVTGAGAGIGRSIAERFAREGARVVVGDIDEGAAQRTAAELEGEAVARRVDVTSSAEVAALVATARDRASASPPRRPRPTKQTGSGSSRSTSPARSSASSTPCR